MLFPQIIKSLGLTLIVTSLWLSGYATATNFRAPGTSVTSIQETRFVILGGVEQWITIRGANRANPVLKTATDVREIPEQGLHRVSAVLARSIANRELRHNRGCHDIETLRGRLFR